MYDRGLLFWSRISTVMSFVVGPLTASLSHWVAVSFESQRLAVRLRIRRLPVLCVEALFPFAQFVWEKLICQQ